MGRIAVYVAMVVPVFYALTRYAWAVGIRWGMSEEHFRSQQESGMFISGLFLATFGLAGRRAPIALAVIPASIVSVLFMVGGITIGSRFAQMAEAVAVVGEDVWIVAGPVLLFPVWAVSLAVATLGYYYRRRGLCNVCGRGTSGEAAKPPSR